MRTMSSPRVFHADWVFAEVGSFQPPFVLVVFSRSNLEVAEVNLVFGIKSAKV